MGLINKTNNHYLRLVPGTCIIDNGIVRAYARIYENIAERDREKENELYIYMFRNKLKDFLSMVYQEKYNEDPETYSTLWQFLDSLLYSIYIPFEQKIYIDGVTEPPVYVPPISKGTKAYDICKSLGFEDKWIDQPIRIVASNYIIIGPQREIYPIDESVDPSILDLDLSIIYTNIVEYWAKSYNIEVE